MTRRGGTSVGNWRSYFRAPPTPELPSSSCPPRVHRPENSVIPREVLPPTQDQQSQESGLEAWSRPSIHSPHQGVRKVPSTTAGWPSHPVSSHSLTRLLSPHVTTHVGMQDHLNSEWKARYGLQVARAQVFVPGKSGYQMCHLKWGLRSLSLNWLLWTQE